MAFIPIEKRDDLRIGLYIKIEGSWFSHPFSTNTFKIKLAKDLATIRELKKVKLLYDPDRSDPKPTTTESSEEAPSFHENVVKKENDPPLESPTAPVTQEQKPSTQPSSEEIIEARREAFTVRRKQLKKTDQAYQGVLQQSKLMFHELRTGHSKAMARASSMVESLEKVVGDPTSSMALMNLMSTSEDVEDFFMHSLNVCALSMMLAQAFTNDNDDLQSIGIGALFHDLGLLEHERKNESPKSYRTTPDSKALRNHPAQGRKMTEKFFGTSNHSLDIIEHHHERLDGSGYPSALLEEDIGLFTKIVMVVDEYDELCNQPDITKSLTPYEALCYLYAKRRGPLWNDAVVALVQMLGVYPPGSFVELSDDRLGIVSSVNPQSRMAPWVMVYSSEIPREESLIIDLSQEASLSINKSFQPKEVPYAIREYLNPRRIISYFPSQAEPQEKPSPERLFSSQSLSV